MIFDRDQMRMVLAIVVVAVLAAGILGVTNILTREPIARAQKEALHKALAQVLPQHANDAQADSFNVDAVAIYPAKDGLGNVRGFAWEVVAPDGYSGSIRILVGLEPEGAIHAIRVTDHRETPGLGDGIVKNSDWLQNFSGRVLEGSNWKVKKDGGDFDQFTGATITPRAVVKAVKGALAFYNSQRQVILNAVEQQNRGKHASEHEMKLEMKID
ncbi:RnfABCDGE type electron transport complex subunit G [Mariprofundus sp. KV]|uniref:RnfABCDGE type electron transport complex subunit G n=1 Tax=Mariprofundus sp. KV TaxID=2608715 RepID=UPI0015A4B5D6|nr:RnfABCDGE type electron transport complex subunit G [Mariprofundus sp. KV]NWF36037.1 RnfABCDGE type electron transport complex subunit G [Mariprofundus sp. KV]